jgi:hypothetical protein
MQTKIKAALAVTIMVAAAFVALIPAVIADEQNSDASSWAGNTSENVTKNYAFSYKVILPMSNSVFTVTSNNDVKPAVDESYKSTATVSGVTGQLYKTGATVTATIIKDTILTFTAYSTLTGEHVERTITFTIATAETAFNGITEFNGVVDSEFSQTIAAASIPTGYTAVSYSAVGMPTGLTMEKDGKIYGAPAVAGDYTVTVYALLTNADAAVYSSEEITINVIAAAAGLKYADVVGSVTDAENHAGSSYGIYVSAGDSTYNYVHSDAKGLVYNLKTIDGVTYNSIAVPANLGSGIVLDGNKVTVSAGTLNTMSGEFTIELKVTQTQANGDSIVSYVDLVFYVIPAESFLTTPVAGMQIVYA